MTTEQTITRGTKLAQHLLDNRDANGLELLNDLLVSINEEIQKEIISIIEEIKLLERSNKIQAH